jgi:hypothetical protein
MSNNSKFGPNAVFLFAVATLALAIAVTYIVPHISASISPKVMAAVYFAVFGAGATAAMFLSSASALRTIGAFAIAAAGLGIFYYVVVARVVAEAAQSLGATSGGGIAAASGLIFGVGFFVDALAAGIAGTLFGSKLRRGMAASPLAKH